MPVRVAGPTANSMSEEDRGGRDERPEGDEAFRHRDARKPVRRPIRILFTSYTAEWTGPTNSLLHLLRELGSEYRPAVLLPGRGAFSRALEAEGVPLVRVPRLDKWSIPSTVRLLKAEGYDLLYANNQSGSSRNAILAARLAGVPSVCHVRGMIGGESWGRFWFLRLPAAVVAVSRAAAEGAAKFVPSSRLHMVHNGIDLVGFDARGSAGEDGGGGAEDGAAGGAGGRGSVDVPPGAPLLVSVSHVCRRKGQLHLVEALARLAGRVPEVHLVLLGSLEREPGYVERVRDRAAVLGVEDRLRLPGFRRDVSRIVAAADVFVHAALADPHPRAVLEAMAARRPVVAFAVDGVAETVVEGETGRLVPPGNAETLADALADLLTDAEARKRMGLAGRRRVEERFTSKATARGVEAVIRSVLGRPGREGSR